MPEANRERASPTQEPRHTRASRSLPRSPWPMPALRLGARPRQTMGHRSRHPARAGRAGSHRQHAGPVCCLPRRQDASGGRSRDREDGPYPRKALRGANHPQAPPRRTAQPVEEDHRRARRGEAPTGCARRRGRSVSRRHAMQRGPVQSRRPRPWPLEPPLSAAVDAPAPSPGPGDARDQSGGGRRRIEADTAGGTSGGRASLPRGAIRKQPRGRRPLRGKRGASLGPRANARMRPLKYGSGPSFMPASLERSCAQRGGCSGIASPRPPFGGLFVRTDFVDQASAANWLQGRATTFTEQLWGSGPASNWALQR